jgi:hypothetical protein
MTHSPPAPGESPGADQQALFALFASHLRRIDAGFNALGDELLFQGGAGRLGRGLRRRLRRELRALVYDIDVLARDL